MKKNTLYALWGGLFIVCAALGFIPAPAGAARVVLSLLSAAFFVPPAILLCRAVKQHDVPTLKLVRNLSALSLGLTLLLVILNILSALGSTLLGDILHGILVIVSSPMICSGQWALSMFAWACLLMVSLSSLWKGRKSRN